MDTEDTRRKQRARVSAHASYLRHKDKVLARNKVPQVLAYQAAYRTTHRKENIAYQAAYRATHRDEKVAGRIAYRTAHAEEIRARDRARQGRSTDMERLRYATPFGRAIQRAKNSRRRVRKRNNGGSHTAAEWVSLCWTSGWRCDYCTKPLHWKTVIQEHRIPVARGGSDDISNIAVSCAPCNLRKRTMTDVEFMALLAD